MTMSYYNKMALFQSMLCCLVIIFLSSVQAAPEYTAPEYMYNICRNGTNYPPNNIFQANRKVVLSGIASNATQNNGYYYNYTAGRNNNMVYGLSLCQGDLAPKDCQECVITATGDILTRCPNQTTGVIWYGGCIVRYDIKSFFSSFSKEDETFAVYMYNTGNVSEPQFPQELNRTLNELAIRTKPMDNNQIIKAFAYQSVNISALQTLYALFQCIPDLTEADCNRCLRVGINLLQNNIHSRGGRAYLPSCIVRYELYPFYGKISTDPNSVTQEIHPPPPPPAAAPPSPLTRPKGNGANSSKVVAATVAPICVAMVIFFIGCYSYVNRKRNILAYTPQKETGEYEIATVENLKFELDTIEEATNNFSPQNKIGAGGFGDVFKGVLANEQQIAVKRLSKSSGQGSQEFQNEAILVAKLQHRNLVRLLGFCLQGDEKILVYEYIQNKSLDKILFDPERQKELDWSKRFKIIGGIVRGMVYLHEDSRLRIIHRDLKTSNILLDEDMNAKISDFGMARICGGEQTYGNTNRIVGTYGYMSPEYAMHGQFSTKSDVFSFGVLLLEIISGKKNTTFYQSDSAEDLLSYAWKQWKNGTPLELMDHTITDLYSRNEVLKCIQIGLLCVQENVDDRCSMASVLAMLTSDSSNIALPKQPPFFFPSHSGSQAIEGIGSDRSTSKSLAVSVDDSLITGVYGR